jgi:hypothetical protein
MLSLAAAVLNFVTMVVGLLVKLVMSAVKLVTGLVRAIIPGK